MRTLPWIWAGPNTLIGLIACALCRASGGDVRVVDGVVEAHGGWVTPCLGANPIMRGGIAAITLGHVVLGRDPFQLDRTRVHERVHVRQYEAWGPFFLPAYFASSAWCALRGRDPYRDNRFEREAYRIEAEHRERFV